MKSTEVGQADESSSPGDPPSSSRAISAETNCAPSAVSLTPATPSSFNARTRCAAETPRNSLTHDGASDKYNEHSSVNSPCTKKETIRKCLNFSSQPTTQ